MPILHLAILCSDLGAALFGGATMRAGVLPRWFDLLLVIGGRLDIVAEYADPMVVGMYPSIELLIGSALAWMG